MYEFDFSALLRDGLGMRLLYGFGITLELAALSLFFALIIGFVVGMAYWSGGRFVRPVFWLYVEFARNTPALVQLLFWYFSFALIFPRPVVLIVREYGLAFVASVLTLTLYHGAFIAEVVRSGLRAVPQSQYDAARALGFSFIKMMRKVILPQAVRISLPSLINETVSLLKNTPLAIAIGVAEMSFQAKYISTYYFRGVEALFVVTIVYLILCGGTSYIGRIFNQRLSQHYKREDT